MLFWGVEWAIPGGAQDLFRTPFSGITPGGLGVSTLGHLCVNQNPCLLCYIPPVLTHISFLGFPFLMILKDFFHLSFWGSLPAMLGGGYAAHDGTEASGQ